MSESPPHSRRQTPARRFATQALVSAGLATAVLAALHLGAPPRSASAAFAATPVTMPQPGLAAPRSFADLAEAVTPAVVNISARSSANGAGRRQPPQLELPPDAPLGRHFEEFLRQFRQQGPQALPGPNAPSHGSGFIIDPAGLIVTNDHVVRNADQISVTLHDGRKFDAVLVGRDPKTDLAVLEIESGEPLAFAEFGDSDAVRVGDWVVAVGNPFGLGGTVTAGIVSARGRDIRSGPFDDFLQIDAPINRGNSGGPLFDESGRVIGVNTAIFSPSGGSVGIGFAIPADIALSVVAELREHGYVDRGWMGVQIQPVTEGIADSLGLDTPAGALVAEVLESSPAERAGILVGDVILEFGDVALGSFERLARLVASSEARDEVAVVVWRDGARETLRLVVGAMPESDPAAAPTPAQGTDTQPELGLELAPVTRELSERYRIEPDVEGAVIVAVEADSPVAREGLRPGDVIVRVGRAVTSTPAEVVEEVRRAVMSDARPVLLLVERTGHRRFVAVPQSGNG